MFEPIFTPEQLERNKRLELLSKEAAARFAALSPEEKKIYREAQRKSWVVGELMLEHPDMTREQAEKLYMDCY